jgi:hypothetical protein
MKPLATTRAAILGLAMVPLLGGCGPVGGGTPSPTATTRALPTTTAAPTATTAASPAQGPCDPARLVARITLWEGAAGHRIAHVELTNTASAACQVADLATPQLVDGTGAVLIDGTPPASSSTLSMTPGAVFKTLVQDGNYCGPAPAPPVSVAFVFPGGLGRIVATPLSATDTSGLPPCLGAPGSAGDIEMQPWAP